MIITFHCASEVLITLPLKTGTHCFRLKFYLFGQSVDFIRNMFASKYKIFRSSLDLPTFIGDLSKGLARYLYYLP